MSEQNTRILFGGAGAFSEAGDQVDTALDRELDPYLEGLSSTAFSVLQRWTHDVLGKKVTNFFLDQDVVRFNRFQLFAEALINIATHHTHDVEQEWLDLINAKGKTFPPILMHSQEMWPYLKNALYPEDRWQEYFCRPEWPYAYRNFHEETVDGRFAPLKKIEYRLREAGTIELMEDIASGKVAFGHDFESFLLIQKYMLKDVYPWAGMPRNAIDMEFRGSHLLPVNTCKFQFQYCDADSPAIDFDKIKQKFGDEFTVFTPCQEIASEAESIFADLDRVFYEEHRPALSDIEPVEERITAFAKTAAPFYLRINQLHPLRDGNGMTQMIFFTLLAQEQGLGFFWKEGEKEFKDRLVESIKIFNSNGHHVTPESVAIMTQLFSECLSPLAAPSVSPSTRRAPSESVQMQL